MYLQSSQCCRTSRVEKQPLDSFKNIVAGSGFVHLLFFVPGIDEVLRVGSKGAVTAELESIVRMVEFGPPACGFAYRGQ